MSSWSRKTTLVRCVASLDQVSGSASFGRVRQNRRAADLAPALAAPDRLELINPFAPPNPVQDHVLFVLPVGGKRRAIVAAPSSSSCNDCTKTISSVMFSARASECAVCVSDRAASASCAALWDFQGGQHSRGQDGSDQLAIVHYTLPLFASARSTLIASHRC
jgi:hypothetical protein